MSLLVLSAANVKEIASTFSSRELQKLMAQVFSLVSRPSTPGSDQTAYTPHRTSIPTAHHTALFMPARISHPSLLGTTIKAVCVPRSPADTRGLPASTLVLDEDTGAVKAIVNARSLTALRNAAGSLLSTNLVGPSNPTSIVAFGAGQQIEAHLDLHIRHLPSIARCTVINRTINPRVLALQRRLQTRFPNVSFSYIANNPSAYSQTKSGEENHEEEERVKEALLSTNLVICATSSTVPLFSSNWVRAGTHVILIGSYTPAMREVDAALIRRAISPIPGQPILPDGRCQILLVDSQDACAREAGELIDAGVGAESVVEIGRLVTFGEDGELVFPSRVAALDGPDGAGEGPITIFKSVGVGLQDVAIACAIVRKAEEVGCGTTVLEYD